LTKEYVCLFDCDRSKEFGRLFDCDRSNESACLYYCGRFPHCLPYIVAARTTQHRKHVLECVYIGPQPSTGRGVDHIENTSSIVLYKHSARTTAGNTACLLLCDVLPLSDLAVGRYVIVLMCVVVVHKGCSQLLAFSPRPSMMNSAFYVYLGQVLEYDLDTSHTSAILFHSACKITNFQEVTQLLTDLSLLYYSLVFESQVTVEARKEEESHCQKHAQSCDGEN
jgi:hypothetical protein